HLTELGRLLRRDQPDTQWHLAVLLAELIEPTPDAALFAVRTGGTAFEHAHGCALYAHLAAHPDAEALFAEAMTARAACLHAQVIEAVDWTGVHHVVDVGGNHGGFLAAILDHLPEATGLLFDQPQIVAGAASALDAAGVADRVDVEGGDFFDAVPPGGDLYLVANVLWNWDDERAGRILRRCRDAMAPSARLLISEPVLPPGNEQHPAKLLDLGNFWLNGGRTRTPAAWRTLLADAGFELVRIAETELEWSVLEARPLG
ncbi:MAG TPA: methyltransferase, partial [Acidimicrobiales bacterium]|nr:methyltransferase [Acidimicrobiales bacterium]